MRWNKTRLTMLFLLGLPCAGLPQSAGDDEYTRYELLEPASASFRIVYDVTAITPGARFYFNPIRKGSEARDESVLDRSTGTALRFKVVSGQKARDAGHSTADLETDYIQVHLLRPVPDNGEARIRIDKTYRDPKSYFRDGDAIVFDRRLGIKKNIVVLPQNYELLSCNVPSQILEEPDGRIAVSFINAYPVAAPLVVRAKPLPRKTDPKPESGGASRTSASTITMQAPALDDIAFPERARQDKEIVYFLNPPETHSFRLYHDYTESKEGVARYVNVVRSGSKVSEPSARLLDTGEALETETLAGERARKAGLLGDDAGPDAEVVLIHFPPVKKGRTTRIRIEETYTDPSRYGLVGERLLWRRSFGRPFNDIVLPEGWYLTSSSIPATVTQDEDGRVRLSFVNGRPDTIDVLLTARKR